ncbi:PspC domain-containing protein [Mucilaginibacter antarcticus]|uniref:PspC domain-containing protein n=1 Tax=Mucilaginibacter antarcticus TaxID=1855725 RepID=A0ABW5XJ66_9SPHI
MNKTIIININGTVFHIEEDAYEILKQYMTDVKRHFMNSADSHEITTDIENRIAEMFSDILIKDSKQVIIEQDVKQVVEQMGTVEDFVNAESDEPSVASNPFAYTNTGSRALFRDPDDHLIGGVCSGLANYFDIQPIWVRLLFAVAVAFFGTGILLYAILWIVIPRAHSRADRMAMKGEKLNLQGFKNSFEEESNLRTHMANLRAEAKPLIYKLRDFFGEFFFHLGQFFKVSGKVLVKLFGILVLLTCLGFAITLIVLLAMGTVWADANPNLFSYEIMTNQYANRLLLAGFVAAFLPLLAIFLLTLNAIFKTRAIDKSVGSVIFIIWLFSVGVLAYYGTKVASEFQSSASFNQTLTLKPATKNTYHLKLNDIKYFTHDDSVRLDMKSDFKNMVVTVDGKGIDELMLSDVSINIERSDVAQPILIETFRAKGQRFEDALRNARNTSYIFSQKDSVLTFDRYLQKAPNTGWHDQSIELTLKVPLNAVLVIDEDINDYIRNYANIGECNKTNKRPEGLRSAAYIMSETGLGCKIDTLVLPKLAPIDSATVLKKK